MILSIIFLGAWLLMGTTPLEYLNDAALVTLPFPLLAGLICLPKGAARELGRALRRRESWLPALLLTALFCLLLSPDELFKCSLLKPAFALPAWEADAGMLFRLRLYAARCLWLPVFAAGLYACLLRFCDRAPRWAYADCPSGRALPVCRAVIIGVSACFCAACYPALLHYDGLTAWKQVIGDMAWSDGHPATFTAMVWLLCALPQNPFPFIVFQTAVWAATSLYALRLLEKHAGRTACVLYTALSLTLGVAIYSLLGTLQKDVLFSVCLLGFSMSLYGFAAGERSAKDCARMGLYALGVLLTRHGMLLVVGGALLILALATWKRARDCAYRALIVLACAAVCFAGLRTLTLRLTDAEPSPGYFNCTTQMFLLAAYASNCDTIDPETAAVMERVAPIELWQEGYRSDPYFADTVSRTYGVLGERVEIVDAEGLGPELTRACLRFLTREPGQFLRAFFDLNAIAWEIARPDEDPERAIVELVNSNPSVKVFYPHMVARESALARALSTLTLPLHSAPVVHTLVYRNGGNLFLVALALFIALRRRRARPMLICLTPSALVIAGLMFVTPCQETRYVLGAKLVSLFVLALACGLCRKESLDKAALSAYDMK